MATCSSSASGTTWSARSTSWARARSTSDDYDVWDRRPTPERSGGATSRRSARPPRSGMFDVMAHPDLVEFWGGERPRPDGDLRRYYELAIEGIADAGSPSRCRPPACASRWARSTRRARSSRWCLEAGCPVALSSDAHVPDASRLRLREALELLERLGVQRDRRLRAPRAPAGADRVSAHRHRLDTHRFDAGRAGWSSAGSRSSTSAGSRATPTPTCSPHAVIDALLGAAGARRHRRALPRHRRALARTPTRSSCCARSSRARRARRGAIVHVDVTVLLEAPSWRRTAGDRARSRPRSGSPPTRSTSRRRAARGWASSAAARAPARPRPWPTVGAT